MRIGNCVLVNQPRINKLTPPFDPDPYFIKCMVSMGSMVTAERRNKTITRNKEHFILLSVDNKNKLNYRNINNENGDDFDFDFVKPTTENENNPSPPIRRYPVRTRNRPTFFHELTGWS